MLAFFIVCPLVFLAGLVDSIAGGGGLISLPAYILAGVPTHCAIATNKLSSSIGTVVSTARLLKNGCVEKKVIPWTVISALTGAVIGAKISLFVDAVILKRMLVVVLPIVAIYIFRCKRMDPEEPFSLSFPKECIIMTAIAFVMGTYDGFYGPGTGTFLLIGFTRFAKIDVRTAAGNVKVVNLSSNIAALVTFILAGKIVWALGLCAAVFSIAGHYVGSGLVLKDGTKVVKPVIVIVLCLLFLKIIFG